MVDTGTKSGLAAGAAALAAAAIGAFAFIGWIFQIDLLKTMLAGAVAMNPVTAVGLILAGASLTLSLVARDRGNKNSRARPAFLARACGLVVAFIGLMRLGAIVSGCDAGVDQWLFPAQVSHTLPLPSRIAPNAALNFLLVGVALVFVGSRRRSVRIGVEVAAVIAAVGSLLAVLGYAYDIQIFYRLGVFIPMALPTALAFMLIITGILLAHTDDGLPGIFAGDSAAGVLARRLLPAAVLVPAGLGWLTLRGEKGGIYPVDFGGAAFAAGNILVFAYLVCRSASELFRADLERKKAENAMRESEERFRQFADNVTDVFWMSSPDLQVMHYLSPGYELVWGRSIASLFASPHQWIEAILPGERAAVAAIFAALTTDQPEVSAEYRIARPDGTIRWVHDRGFQVRDGAGRLVRLAGIASDVTERKRVEEILQQSQTLARMTDRLTRMGAWSVDLSGTRVVFSDQVCAIHEVPPGFAPAVGEAIHFYAPEFREAITGAFEACARDGAPFDLELQLITAKGRRIWVRSIGEAERDAAGVIRGVRGAFQDISQRKAAQAETMELADRLTTTLESLTDGFFTLDRDWCFTYVNREAERMFGRSRTELLGKLIWAKFPEARGTIFQREYERAVRDNTAVEFETFYPPFDVWYEARAYPSAHGLAVYFRDITAIRQAGETVSLLSSAVEQSKESIVITNAELDLPGPGIIFVNPAFTKMTGYTASDVIGKTPRILQGPRTDRTVLDRLRQNLEGGGAFEGETVNYRKDGTEFDLEWQIAPIRNADGQVTHFVAIQRDITARKQLESRMFQSQKLETVGKLAGGIAHEFNGILTAIIGQTELLLGDLPVGSPLAKNATEINRAAERAAVLTRQLLAYGRKQFLQPETLDLNRVIMGMESMLRYMAGRGVNLRIVSAASLKAVRADAGQLEQVIMNMAINACEAMPNGGKLTLETGNISFNEELAAPDPELKPGNYVLLAITDTGVGMTPEMSALAFEPFFTTKGVGQGTGLGLSTCYGIIKQSGGHISVYSEPGQGASFKIYLPQVEPQTEISLQRPNPPELPRGTETIMLVEDDPAMREMAATLLRRLGYTVVTAGDGIEAMSLIRRPGNERIDLVFTDVVMPRMNGRELADLVLALNPRTRILFASAYTENAIVHQGMLNPGVAFLQKPFTPSAMACKIREVLDKTAVPEPDAGRTASGLPGVVVAGFTE